MSNRDGTCVFAGCCCCYSGFDCENIVICCVGETDCLCFRHGVCLSVNSQPLGCGLTTKPERGECCKIGCFCCDFGLIAPTKLCAQAQQQLCCFAVASCPQSDHYLSKCVCAYLFVQCCPECGICAPAPECKALDALLKGEQIPISASTMDR